MEAGRALLSPDPANHDKGAAAPQEQTSQQGGAPAAANVYMSEGGGGGGGASGSGGRSAVDLMERKRELQRQLQELDAQLVGGGNTSHND